MDKKKLCADVFSGLFGPATGRLIEASTDSEDNIVEKCKAKITSFFGAERADLFIAYLQHPTDELKGKILVR